MQSHDIRKRFLDFFEKRGHAIIPSASLVPENDPTTLFTGSGMQPMVPYLLGESHPMGTRIADSQKSFRAEDIEEVGDNRHTTFFEMLGNWSLGDYFRDEQIRWMSEFLFDEIGIDPKKLYITVFDGDEKNSLPRDTESAELWKTVFAEKGIDAQIVEIGTEEKGAEVGMQGGRIFYYGSKKNWWSRAGVPENMPIGEPGGPDSEMFYEFSEVKHDPAFGEKCHPNCDCGRYLEIGNNVFMTYKKVDEKKFELLPRKNIDFGGGLERITAATNDTADVFRIDTLWSIVKKIEELTGQKYEEHELAFRIIADHIRGAVFMIGDGVMPSNTEQGYFVRRLLRRAIFQLNRLKSDIPIGALANVVVDEYKDHYLNLAEQKDSIYSAIAVEETKFSVTIDSGLKQFEKASKDGSLSGIEAFNLYQTHGFPIEMTEELAEEKGIKVDREAFDLALKEHQEKSRTASAGKFKGGLGDASEETIRYHTATHLLNAALREVLGEHIEQKGSNITPERLRFDFSHGEKLTDEEKQQVTDWVNEVIQKDLPVTSEEMPIEKAREIGALGVFGDKYDDVVRVYTIGDPENPVSREICGGPHIEHTGELGVCRIKKEQASSAGVRRIKAILE